MRSRVLVAFLTLSCLLSAKRVITHEDVWLMKRISAPQVSPDGSQVIFTMVEPSYDPAQQVSDLWIVPADGSAPPRRLTSSKAGESGVVWSPDGTQIAFTTRREGDEASQIYVLSLKGGEATRLTTISTGASNPQWSPDGKWLLFESMVYPNAQNDADNRKAAAERRSRKYNARVYESMPMRFWDSWLDDRKPHPFLISVEGGEPKDLLAASQFAQRPGFAGFNDGLSAGQTLRSVWTPDGRGIVFAAILNRDQMMHTLTESHLFVLPLDATEPKQLTSGNEDYSRPQFSPDGKSLYAMATRRGTKRLYSLTRLARMEWPSGEMKILTEAWDRSVGDVAISNDSGTVWIAAEDDGFDKVFRMPAQGGTVQQAFAVNEGGYSGLSFAENKPVLVGLYGSAVQPNEVALIDVAKGGHRLLTTVNAAKLAELDLPKLEHFWFTAKNGKRIHSVVVLPPALDKSKKYPLIVFPHGGPNAMSKDAFSTRWNYHFLTSPGYALIATNYTGSTGFGEQFADDIERDLLRGPAEEVLQAAEEAIKRYPWIDASRQAAMGASYGGYFMNWFEGHTTHFRCLVNHAGAINNESQYGTNDGGLERELRMGGPIWESSSKMQWMDQSPLRYTGQWKTPMLITQGEQDFRVPMSESMTSFKILQRRKIPSKVIFFPDENHWVLKGENNRFHQTQVLAWLERFLKPEQPAWRWQSR